MKLSEKPCYPMFDSRANARYADLPTIDETGHPLQVGLTFRERLIIALASNSSLTCQIKINSSSDSGLDEGQLNFNAHVLRMQADVLIKQLEEEVIE